MAELSRVVDRSDSWGPEDPLERMGVALSDPIRRSILRVLVDGPAYPTEMAQRFATSPSNLSNHLACLPGCGLVVTYPEGRRIRYELAGPGLAGLFRDLIAVVGAVEACEEHLS